MQAKMFFSIYMVAALVASGCSLYIGAYTRESLGFMYCEFVTDPKFIAIYIANNGYTSLDFAEMQVDSIPLWSEPEGAYRLDAGATAAIGCYYNWSRGQEYTLTLATTRGTRLSLRETAVPAETLLSIEGVSWDALANTTSIVVRNTGMRTREIIGLGIFKQPNWILPVTNRTDLDGEGTLPINQTITVTLSWPNAFALSWTNGETYRFKIIAKTGVGKDFSATAPR